MIGEGGEISHGDGEREGAGLGADGGWRGRKDVFHGGGVQPNKLEKCGHLLGGGGRTRGGFVRGKQDVACFHEQHHGAGSEWAQDEPATGDDGGNKGGGEEGGAHGGDVG